MSFFSDALNLGGEIFSGNWGGALNTGMSMLGIGNEGEDGSPAHGSLYDALPSMDTIKSLMPSTTSLANGAAAYVGQQETNATNAANNSATNATNLQIANNANSAAAANVQQQQAYATQMSNTAYQRGVADIQAAGLNPMLAYSHGGASSPTGSVAPVTTATMQSPQYTSALTSATSSARDGQRLSNEISQLQMDNKLKSEEIENKVLGRKLDQIKSDNETKWGNTRADNDTKRTGYDETRTRFGQTLAEAQTASAKAHTNLLKEQFRHEKSTNDYGYVWNKLFGPDITDRLSKTIDRWATSAGSVELPTITVKGDRTTHYNPTGN